MNDTARHGFKLGYATAIIYLWEDGKKQAAAHLILQKEWTIEDFEGWFDDLSVYRLRPVFAYVTKMQAKSARKAARKLSQSDSLQQDAA